MDDRGWRLLLITPARALTGAPSRVVVGLIKTDAGFQVVIQVGDDTPAVLLPAQAVSEHIKNMYAAIAEKARLDAMGRSR
ncbi:hypothetical protein [Amycolatopsis sp. CA-230715]|uniref:hypothetical protein n=1 Tax=Amycolatopsis sp. CA-230715 TaxID=2745196 RepID=UPI001C037101|nr:hypothetical protein [Amycolatopsis sp. CA-230715]QWF83218.1 hypothetical protein HUW46_06658 [Amycolatopsis sp. CA-230715]